MTKMTLPIKPLTIALASILMGAIPTLSAKEFGPVEKPNLMEPDEKSIRNTLYVDQSATGSRASGSQSSPFVSIDEAVQQARRMGVPVRILIEPGIYRETIDIRSANDGDPLLVLEASDKGEVIVSGSDVFTEWIQDGNNSNLHIHEWTIRRGWEDNPWPGLMPLRERGLRHELLFANGQPLRQVYFKEDLETYTYYVDEEQGNILLQLEEGVKPSQFKIEVTVRPLEETGVHSKLLRIFMRDNVVVRGIRFQHGMTRAFMGAVQILGSQNILFEDIEANWNSGVGILFGPFQGKPSQNVMFRRVEANYNGYMGMSGGIHDGLLEDTETIGNNWRGVAVGATGWAPCGWKFSQLERVIIRRHRAIGNHASGGWLDDEIKHVIIEDFIGMNNLRSGLSVEAVEGPLLVRNAILAGNSAGLNLFDSRNMLVEDSLIIDNTNYQVRLAGSLPLPEEELAKIRPDWRRNRLSKRQIPSDVEFRDTIIGISDREWASAPVFQFGMRDNAFVKPDGELSMDLTLDTIRLSGMTYGHPDGNNARTFPDARNRPVSLGDWQRRTGQDKDARMNFSAMRQYRTLVEETSGIPIEPYTEPDTIAPVSEQVDELEL